MRYICINSKYKRIGFALTVKSDILCLFDYKKKKIVATQMGSYLKIIIRF